MIGRAQLIESGSFDPYYNLAVEQILLEEGAPDACIMYLWQNENTVVIGRNQNAWKEVRTEALEEDGGHLARRLSGGGAVFHDTGNLNFTFLASGENYDVSRHLDVIRRACLAVGIPVMATGRNDLTVEGRKFSGNAFYKSKNRRYHHGTLLVDTDFSKMERYLNPSQEKMKSKGVSSVHSRVANLKEYAPSLTCHQMRALMTRAFKEVYQREVEELCIDHLDKRRIECLRSRNAEWEWLYGVNIPFTYEIADRFSWGDIQIQLLVNKGIISMVKVYSDSMDWELSSVMEDSLRNCRFYVPEMKRKIGERLKSGDVFNDIARMLENQEI